MLQRLRWGTHACLPVLLLALGVGACHADGTGSPARSSLAGGAGVLTGRVTRGPATAVVRPGQADAEAAAGVEVQVRARDGAPVAAVRVDQQGVYRVSLPPGTYEVRVGPLQGMEFTKDLPATISILRDQETRLDVRIDTGVR
jgi:hypothetical protein